ncbi:MAG: hypothetical protein IJ852_06360 [Alphaproteobacteria bacterium]|nr:hypothetical protein [Alphaproteobacteria bacterium]
MDIDAQIREILSRSSPVNDNQAENSDHLLYAKKIQPPKSCSVSVVGNNNVVLCSDWLSLLTGFVLAAMILVGLH